MLRALAALFCAFLSLSTAGAQTYRPGLSPAFRSGFQFFQATTCQNSSLAFYDFVANTGCSAGVTATNSVANLNTSRASVGYDLAATTQFPANVARRTSAGLLIEGASTNYLTQAITFSTWTTGNATVTQAATTSPTGATDAIALTEAATTAEHRIFQQSSGTPAGAYAWSVYAKASTRNWVSIRSSATNVKVANFNIGTGVLGTATSGVTASITSVGNGWYLCVMTTPSGGQANEYATLNIGNADTGTGTQYSYAGDGTSKIFLWGAQLETAATRTSLIPTTTAVATRPADNITLTLPNGVTKVDLSYDNNTTATVSASAGAYTIPANPAGTNLKTLRAY